jgi:hypothetical protein
MIEIIKTFEEMIVEAASLVLAVDEFVSIEGQQNEIVYAGLQLERDHACLELIQHISNNPLLRVLILGAEADRIKNGPNLPPIAENEILKRLFGSCPED